MVWGCFSYEGLGKLTFIDRIMDAVSYVNILSTSLPESAAKMGLRKYIFQHDNDPKHTSRLVCEYLNNKDIQLFEDWPAQSSDLNSIENFWYYIKVKNF